jgi:uncharacterized phage infection (PIP) family protein YhgE
MEEARKMLAELTPSLQELMAQLAKDTEKLKEETTAQAEKTAEKTAEETQAAAKETLAKQERLNDQVEALQDALRSDANKQDVFEDQGRERARDADDAIAMLKEPPPKAAAALDEAADATAPEAQKEALTEAAAEQQKLAEALQQLAQTLPKPGAGESGGKPTRSSRHGGGKWHQGATRSAIRAGRADGATRAGFAPRIARAARKSAPAESAYAAGAK